MFRLFILISLFNCLFFNAQDTTWVQTFTYDSIQTRRAKFDFPASLNTKRFEKVLMYYNLKCSPLTPWDQYNCGEWDYLAYSKIFEHTNVYDSIIQNGKLFISNYLSPDEIDYNPAPYSQKDTYTVFEKNRSLDALTTFSLNETNLISTAPFHLNSLGSTYQMLITATELTNAGILPGDLQALYLYVEQIVGDGTLWHPKIKIKNTLLTELLSYEKEGFTEVYNASHAMGSSQNELIYGENKFLFYQPYYWNGSDNLIIEFSYQDGNEHNNNILFQNEASTNNSSIFYQNKNGVMNFNGNSYALNELSDFDLGNQFTFCFWSKGTGSAGTNTSILEAYDTLNNRLINIHFPWSDNRMYFDAGQSTSYDRIDKSMTTTEIDDNWNHWAFVKNATSGNMNIYKNGVLWHSGTGKNIPIGEIHRIVLGSNINHEYRWKGKLDEFQLYNIALSQEDILANYTKKIDNLNPFWSNLLMYYDFDNTQFAADLTDNHYLLMPSEYKMITFDEYPLVIQTDSQIHPKISLGMGDVLGELVESPHFSYLKKEPNVVFEYQTEHRHFKISNAFVGVLAGTEDVYDMNNLLLSQTSFNTTSSLTNNDIFYYNKPFEIVNNVEIGRYITPYGIGFDLGANGFTYIYDVSDYQHYLKNNVDFEAHNTQELIDVKFAFIEGIPPRDVHRRQAIWEEHRSYQYGEMDNNTVLSAKSIQLADTSDMFKIKTRFTGHGHNGSVNCCEWDSKTHSISINGTPRFEWEIWQETECGDNPNIGQGGTWPYAREGWCPGDMVKDIEHELTPYVAPGQTVTIDYDIENVPANDPDQANGNYVVAMDLISYSNANFQNDASVLDILNPNNYEYYKKFNPSCSYPKVMIQNTGLNTLTSCVIRIFVEQSRTIDFSWTGNLSFLQKEIVEIPINDLNWWYSLSGSHTFTAEIISVNNTTDEYVPNNKKTTQFDSPEMINDPFFIWFTTNNKANENSYKLIKDNGDIVFERTSLQNSTQYKDTFNLEPGCYSIILEDSDHDGISFWASNQYEGESAGSFRVRKVGSTLVYENFPGDFGRYYRYNFSVGLESLSTKENNSLDNFNVYPNPSNGEFYVDFGGEINYKATLKLMNLDGKVILTKEMNADKNHADATINLNDYPDGLYILNIETNHDVLTKKIIKAEF
ncbi:MAG: T9SS type A sorting domain-containing protein [Flavobacteriia bacterium]|nr:T9SS type A sorting domain-containing protein [Flavobacteriia bacterium]